MRNKYYRVYSKRSPMGEGLLYFFRGVNLLWGKVYSMTQAEKHIEEWRYCLYMQCRKKLQYVNYN
jgi:hypothetical protein